MNPADLNSLITIGASLGGVAAIGLFTRNMLSRKLNDIEKIPNLEGRIRLLEEKQPGHDQMNIEVIRMSEQIKGLTNEVRRLGDLFLRRMTAHNDENNS